MVVVVGLTVDRGGVERGRRRGLHLAVLLLLRLLLLLLLVPVHMWL